MKRKIVLSLAFLLLAFGSCFVVYQFKISQTGAGQNTGVYNGYLTCQSCAQVKNGMAMDGVNISDHPENHTVHCLKMPACVASGYGVFMRSANNRYTFYPFDRKGSEQSYQQIVSKSLKKDHLLVTVTGKIQNGILVVNTIREK